MRHGQLFRVAPMLDPEAKWTRWSWAFAYTTFDVEWMHDAPRNSERENAAFWLHRSSAYLISCRAAADIWAEGVLAVVSDHHYGHLEVGGSLDAPWPSYSPFPSHFPSLGARANPFGKGQPRSRGTERGIGDRPGRWKRPCDWAPSPHHLPCTPQLLVPAASNPHTHTHTSAGPASWQPKFPLSPLSQHSSADTH